MADIVIKGGTVFDPLAGTETAMDLFFENGTLSSAAPGEDALTIDASGAYVAPGFIDLNAQVFCHNLFANDSLEADRIGVHQGVACVVDASSAGALMIDAFPDHVHKTQATQIFAFVNIVAPGVFAHSMAGAGAGAGMGTGTGTGTGAANPSLLDLDGVVRAFERHGDWLAGVGVHACVTQLGSFGLDAVKMARKAATLVGRPLMLHLGHAPPLIDDVLDLLRPGDIVTHAYHGRVGGVMGYQDEVISQFKEAVKRGVIVDMGHGQAGFSFKVCEAALEQGMPLHCISSALQAASDVGSLAKTMTKMRALGMSLADVVLRVTANPARAIDIDRFGFGGLVEGLSTTATIFREREGDFDITDSFGESRNAGKFIEPIGCVVADQFYSSQEAL